MRALLYLLQSQAESKPCTNATSNSVLSQISICKRHTYSRCHENGMLAHFIQLRDQATFTARLASPLQFARDQFQTLCQE